MKRVVLATNVGTLSAYQGVSGGGGRKIPRSINHPQYMAVGQTWIPQKNCCYGKNGHFELLRLVGFLYNGGNHVLGSWKFPL